MVGAGAETTEAGYKPDVSLHGSKWHANSPGTLEGFKMTSSLVLVEGLVEGLQPGAESIGSLPQ